MGSVRWGGGGEAGRPGGREGSLGAERGMGVDLSLLSGRQAQEEQELQGDQDA